MKLFLAAAAFLLSGLSGVSAQSGKQTDEKTFADDLIVGTYNGKSITMKDILTRELSEKREEYFQSMKYAFLDFLLRELKKEKPELFAQKEKITDKHVKEFYDGSRLSQNGSYDELKDRIRFYMESNQAKALAGQILDKSQKKGEWKFQFTEPEAFVVSVPVGTAFIKGNKKTAKLMLLEFSDYQCPYCKKVQPILESLRKKYGKEVAFGYRHFPLDFHTEADEAAVAVECARDQGKFEELHKVFFNLSQKPFPDVIIKAASKIKGIKMADFEKCFKQEKYRERVNNDIALGKKIGITGTPGFVLGEYDPKTDTINGEIFSGAIPIEAFEEKFKTWMKKTKS